jgi:phenylacetic acid degradation operon negative regulatory protein
MPSYAESAEPQDGVDLPRAQAGSSPQHLLATLLGGYWYGQRAALPSAALVALLAEFGVTPVSARTALSRLVRRGLLEADRDRRRTSYALTTRAAEALQRGVRRVLSFGAPDAVWSGRWTVASFSVAEEQRARRHLLRSRLVWLGFAPLYDGVWVCPHDRAAQATAVLRELGVETATVMRAEVVGDSPAAGQPIRAWDLDALRAVYEGLQAEYEPIRDRLRAKEIRAAEALVVRTAFMDAWRGVPNLDPDLPNVLLPTPWPRGRTRELFIELYDGLAELAERRVVEVVGRFDPDLAGLVRCHRTDFRA